MPHFYDTPEFEAKYTYPGSDLGAVWSEDKTAFRLWAPTANAVSVNLYRSGTPYTDDLIRRVPMKPDVNGTWVAEAEGDLRGVYYTYLVDVDDKVSEACDPYARTTGVNGLRAMIFDPRSTDPEGWEQDADPHAGMPFSDAVIYELHIRDLSMDESSGIRSKGKYLGVIETGTVNGKGKPTGLDHIKSLGITHLHILPMFDFGFVDESRPDIPQFNWGYDPVNFNVPEGSYSTDPWNGDVRVWEVKRMVKGLHDNGISVVMDVVYNHVYEAGEFCFNRIVPMYFSRFDEHGKLLNDSCCGNDTASERSMVRKYIVDSVKYWADEYHIDGFRFDLVGLLDVETIQEILEEVHKDHPNVIFYGEGWDMYTGPLREGMVMATQRSGHLIPGFSFFNDSIRDLLKGSVFENTEPGFVSGGVTDLLALASAFRGAPSWAVSPVQSVNYVSCHDNNTLLDRISLSTPRVPRKDRVRMNNLAAAFCLTAQGIPFFQAGEELLRTKPLGRGKFDENSYRSPDSINAIKWDTLNRRETQRVLAYYKGLIALRASAPLLRETSGTTHIPVGTGRGDSIAFNIGGEFWAIFNAGRTSLPFRLPEGTWDILVNADKAGVKSLGTAEGTVNVEPISAMVLKKRV